MQPTTPTSSNVAEESQQSHSQEQHQQRHQPQHDLQQREGQQQRLALSSSSQSSSSHQQQQQKDDNYCLFSGCFCCCFRGGGGCNTSLNGYEPARGYNIASMARSSIIISNIFLSSSLIHLASQEAGCLEDAPCENKVYGFKPVSLVTNIAVISGVTSAICMPVVGVMVDYTSHRRNVGIFSAALLVSIQAAQIGTVARTWFVMAILQSLAGFLYEVQTLASYAYLPEMAKIVGEKTMTNYTSTFVMMQFIVEAVFLVVITALIFGLKLGDVRTAQLSQALNTATILVLFTLGWKLLPQVDAKHSTSATGSSNRVLLFEGFAQLGRTVRKIRRRYSRSLLWFLIGVTFAEASAMAYTTVSVAYLDGHLRMTSTEIGLFFLVTLLGTIPGSKLGGAITAALDPNRSWQLSMLLLTIATVTGALVVDRAMIAAPAAALLKPITYLWGICLGLLLGWYYSSQNVFFSMCLPKGQEAELSGFFVYCTQILSWLSPLLFTALIEANVSQTYGVISVTAFFLIAIVMLRCFAAPWDGILRECHLDENNNNSSRVVIGDDKGDDKKERDDDVGDCQDSTSTNERRTDLGESGNQQEVGKGGTCAMP